MYDYNTDKELMIILAIFGIVCIIVLITYVISGIAHYTLYKKMGKPSPWLAWVPYCNLYAFAEFLQEETESEEWQKWAMTFYVFGGIIPFLGSLVTLAGSILVIVNECKYISMKSNGSVVQYICVFLFPIILPFLWWSNYDETYTRRVEDYSEYDMMGSSNAFEQTVSTDDEFNQVSNDNQW